MGRRCRLVLLVAVCFAGAVGVPAGAAGPAKRTAVFNVTAVHSGGGQVTITSKVWITPTQARADISHPLQGDLKFLVTDGYQYQLDPKGKRGIKRAIPEAMRKRPDNFTTFIHDFTFDAEGALKKAKKVRTETLSGYECNVYSGAETVGQQSRSITVWMPQKMEPNFPIKAILSDRMSKPGATLQQTTTVTLSEIQLNVPVAPAVFAVPAGYQVKTITENAKPTPAR